MSEEAGPYRILRGVPARTVMALAPRQPPYSVEAEQSVLGGLILDNRRFEEVSAQLRDADFYRSDHQLIYQAIGALINANKPCDFVTLSEALRESGQLEDAGGLAHLGSLANDTPSAANVLAYAEIVAERSILRRLIATGGDISELGYRPEGRTTQQLADQAEQWAHGIRAGGDRSRNTCFAVPQIMEGVITRVHEAHDRRSVGGLTTGFREFDQMTQGLGAGDLMILAARPSMGKTSLALNIAEHLSFEHGTAVVLFSMEMSAEQIGFRLLASRAGVSMQRLRAGELSDIDMDRLVPVVAAMQSVPLYVDEAGGLSPMDLRSRARRLKRSADVRLVIVDYLQLMQVPGQRENRANEVSEISRSLKALAKELGVPVIALSQLNRGLENRPDKHPRLSDLRESGGIEQDADLVVFVHRPIVFDDTADPEAAEIIIAKQRNGPVGKIEVRFRREQTRFVDAG